MHSVEELETVYNSLLILRTLTKYIVEHEPLETSPSYFNTPDIVAMATTSQTGETDNASSPTTLKHGQFVYNMW